LEPVPIKRAPLITLVPICRSLPGAYRRQHQRARHAQQAELSRQPFMNEWAAAAAPIILICAWRWLRHHIQAGAHSTADTRAPEVDQHWSRFVTR
jgi:hypothetical protein